MKQQVEQCIDSLYAIRNKIVSGERSINTDEISTILHEAADLLLIQSMQCPSISQSTRGN